MRSGTALCGGLWGNAFLVLILRLIPEQNKGPKPVSSDLSGTALGRYIMEKYPAKLFHVSILSPLLFSRYLCNILSSLSSEKKCKIHPSFLPSSETQSPGRTDFHVSQQQPTLEPSRWCITPLITVLRHPIIHQLYSQAETALTASHSHQWPSIGKSPILLTRCHKFRGHWGVEKGGDYFNTRAQRVCCKSEVGSLCRCSVVLHFLGPHSRSTLTLPPRRVWP